MILTNEIKNATNIDELLTALELAKENLNEQDYKNLDLSDLPTFDGDEPSDTCDIFSWDEGRFLVLDGNGDFVLEPRN